MNSTFQNLPEEKRQRIIDAAMEEFAKNGYDKASTNNIIEEAGISKGLLFHYFGSKKNLYLYLVDYCIDYFKKYLYDNAMSNSSDILERSMELSILKLKMFSDAPSMYGLVASAFIDAPEKLKDVINERYKKLYSENSTLFFSNVDMSKFKDGIDTQKALEIIFFTFEGLEQKYIEIFKSREDKGFGLINQALSDFKEYINVLKMAFYKDGA